MTYEAGELGIVAPRSECNLELHGACCCTCVHHLVDHWHCCTTNVRPDSERSCVCSTQRGWICVPPEFPRAYSGWSEHGLCEMHQAQSQTDGGKRILEWIEANPEGSLEELAQHLDAPWDFLELPLEQLVTEGALSAEAVPRKAGSAR